MPKKTQTAKRKTSPAKSKAKKTGPANKKSTAKKTTVKKPAGKRGGLNRELNPDTGFVVGTDQDAIASALLEGGESRAEIAARLQNELDTETRNGTEKQIANMMSGVINKMLARGFTVESSFVVSPPTAASKRAATRAANAAAAKKTTAKKTTTKSKAPAKKTAAKKSAPAKKTVAKGKKGKAASRRK